MTKQVVLKAQIRSEKNGNAKKIRSTGLIPAVVYGNRVENKHIKIKKHDFEKVFAEAGEFNLIDLAVDNSAVQKVIIKDVQKNAINSSTIHVDFYQVDMKKKITTEIPLNFIGESKAVKELGGTLVKNMDSLEVECLPGDLISHIDVDVAKLETFEDMIRIQDLILPAGIELASETNEVVVMVSEQKAEEEIKQTAEPAAPEAAPAEEKKDQPEKNK